MALSLFAATTSFTAPSVYVAPAAAAVRSSAPSMAAEREVMGRRAAMAALFAAPAAANAVSFSFSRRARTPKGLKSAPEYPFRRPGPCTSSGFYFLFSMGRRNRGIFPC